MTVAKSRTQKPSGGDRQVDAFMERVIAQAPGEVEFHQAVREVAKSVMPIIENNRAYREAKVLERVVVPENVILFRVVWGLLDTMAIFSPKSRLRRVDLPTFGRPMREMNPDLKPVSFSSSAISSL